MFNKQDSIDIFNFYKKINSDKSLNYEYIKNDTNNNKNLINNNVNNKNSETIYNIIKNKNNLFDNDNIYLERRRIGNVDLNKRASLSNYYSNNIPAPLQKYPIYNNNNTLISKKVPYGNFVFYSTWNK